MFEVRLWDELEVREAQSSGLDRELYLQKQILFCLCSKVRRFKFDVRACPKIRY